MVDDQGNQTTQTSGEAGGSSGPEDQPTAPRRRSSRATKGTQAVVDADAPETAAKPARTRAAKATAASPTDQPAEKPATRASAKAGTKSTSKKTSATSASGDAGVPADGTAASSTEATTATKATTKTASTKSASKKSASEKSASKKSASKKSASKKSASDKSASKKSAGKKSSGTTSADSAPDSGDGQSDAGAAVLPVFQAPEGGTGRRTSGKSRAKAAAEPSDGAAADSSGAAPESDGTVSDGAVSDEAVSDGGASDEGGPRRRRRRGGRRRRKGGEGGEGADGTEDAEDAESQGAATSTGPAADERESEGPTRRRRRRRRPGDDSGESGDDPAKTVTRVRKSRSAEDQITAVSGSTRLEAKKQRRREGREAGRRRAPIVSEAEFLARRESVERVMVVRQREELTQIAVLEDKVLVEHYVARESQTSLIGNVYLGRVQNVLPSMEAAFIDIGKGRNAVLYAGEVNWSALGHPEGQPRKIESVLSSGQSVLVQVTKDPVGHKGARLTSQISLAGRFLVYVPDGTTSGISRKLPDTERTRLKTLLKEIVPDTAGVIVRTAAEGASEEELTRDVERLKARWEDIEKKAGGKGAGASLLYGEPDLTLKVVRDLFTEDFAKLVIEGDDAWDTVQGYVAHVAPDLEARLERYRRPESGVDVFAAYRIDEQIAKGLDRKVWLPSGGSLVIDRTEAMTVVDVNTGKFTGSGGNLEETVTKNNLEAAEEIVRQLRLRDIGGIIVVDFIDMVLESNRDLVLRRLVECLGRDRTRHQVAEVTSLGLVQMTRKRIGTGLLEAFSQTCEHCHGRGLTVHELPVEPKRNDDEPRRGRRGRNRNQSAETPAKPVPSPKDVAAHARPAEAEESTTEPEIVEPEITEPEITEPETHRAGGHRAGDHRAGGSCRGNPARGRPRGAGPPGAGPPGAGPPGAGPPGAGPPGAGPRGAGRAGGRDPVPASQCEPPGRAAAALAGRRRRRAGDRRHGRARHGRGRGQRRRRVRAGGGAVVRRARADQAQGRPQALTRLPGGPQTGLHPFRSTPRGPDRADLMARTGG